MKFLQKVVRKYEIYFSETASVEVLRRNLIKFKKNWKSFEHGFKKILKKSSEM